MAALQMMSTALIKRELGFGFSIRAQLAASQFPTRTVLFPLTGTSTHKSKDPGLFVGFEET